MNRPLLITLIILILITAGILIFLAFSGEKETSQGETTYNCASDTYNCDDFTTQAEAQAVFDACGPEDIHQLDGDGNRKACEGLS